jgi:hypothetical protein
MVATQKIHVGMIHARRTPGETATSRKLSSGWSKALASLYTAAVEHEAASTVTVMVEPAGVLKRRIVTDPEPLVSSVQLCPPSEAVASVSGWFEVT